MRPKGGTQIFKKILEFFKKNGLGTSYVSYFDCDSDSIISMPFLDASVRRSVGPSVGPWVTRFLNIAEIETMGQ